MRNPHPADAEPALAADPGWSATSMAASDHAKAHFGMWIQELQRGRAVLSMRVRKEMTNGFAITHGGVVFALADTAFAYACNETEARTVASGAEISFLRPSEAGDVLTATAAGACGRAGPGSTTHGDEPAQEIIAEFRRSFATAPTRPFAGKGNPIRSSAAV